MKKQRWRITTRAVLLLGIAFILTVILAFLLEMLKAEFTVVILVAAVGWYMGVWYLFVSINAKTKLDLELKASDEMLVALKAYSSAISMLNVAISYPPTKFPPQPVPSNYWYNAATEYHQKLIEHWVEFLNTQTSLRETIEANEMALVELSVYYQYIILKHDETSKLFNDTSTEHINNLKDASSQQGFNELMFLYEPMQVALIDQIVICLDFKKILLNKYQSRLFGRTLEPRKPLDDSKVLSQLATKEVVDEMVRVRDAEFIDDVEKQTQEPIGKSRSVLILHRVIELLSR